MVSAYDGGSHKSITGFFIGDVYWNIGKKWYRARSELGSNIRVRMIDYRNFTPDPNTFAYTEKIIYYARF